MRAALVVLAAFLVMEPVTYALHRWAFHGPGWRLHRSHHRTRPGRLEANDVYPALSATVTMALFAAGYGFGALAFLVLVATGVSIYGAAYFLVHDVYVHRRFGPVPRLRFLDRVEEAHRIHHRYGSEPYGMLFPVVPRSLRVRTAAGGRPLPASAIPAPGPAR